ncbi:conjugal transfer nickase/helicase domain-containing protein [Pectobacterium brasiliense]|uniref:conjugal transfer nickase/helicase domain-containing protein n=1 Tax=Pectobacterium brasiliense TaxID=180957 RepID=UPI001968B9E6|nr:TraI domain-containing protein [Pectobacterium brasiliense]MBN3169915.1 TraI domain-containing protein [Pectobacterium brasiliense]
MFNRIKNFIVGTDNVPRNESISPESVCPSGYHPPLPVDALIASPKRQSFLQQLNDNHALPAAFYRQCYLTPLFSLLSRAQNLPASNEGSWAYAGAFGDLTVQFAAYAVRLAKGRTLPPGIPPEEQAAQGLLWNAVVFWSALFYHLPLLCEWEGELDGGECWMPGFTIPGRPFRFRHCVDKLPPSYAQGRVSLLAAQLLPLSALPWLSSIPDAFDCLAQRMQGRPATIALIDELLLSAAEKCGAPSLTGMLPPAPLATESLGAAILPPEPLVASALTSALPDSHSSGAANGNLSSPPPESESAIQKQAPLIGSELVSVLDSAVPEEAVSVAAKQPVTAQAPESTQNDTQALLSLFSGIGESPVPRVEDAPSIDTPAPEEINNQKENENVRLTEPEISPISPSENNENIREDNNKGAVFLEWLSAGLIEGKIRINEEGARAHIVAGFVFLCVPEIFFLFQKETGNKGKRSALQASFERLGVHRVADGKRFLQARIYSTPSGTGTYQNINGYLVKASSLYRGNRIPDESALLILP